MAQQYQQLLDPNLAQAVPSRELAEVQHPAQLEELHPVPVVAPQAPVEARHLALVAAQLVGV